MYTLILVIMSFSFNGAAGVGITSQKIPQPTLAQCQSEGAKASKELTFSAKDTGTAVHATIVKFSCVRLGL